MNKILIVAIFGAMIASANALACGTFVDAAKCTSTTACFATDAGPCTGCAPGYKWTSVTNGYTCAACTDVAMPYHSETAATGTCVAAANCPAGTWADATTNPKHCVTCGVTNCNACTSATTCTACKATGNQYLKSVAGTTPSCVADGAGCGEGLNARGSIAAIVGPPAVAEVPAQCIATCGDGFYLNTVTKTCMACSAGCATCTATTCSACKTTGTQIYLKAGTLATDAATCVALGGCATEQFAKAAIPAVMNGTVVVTAAAPAACVAACGAGFMGETVTLNKVCTACPANCKDCTADKTKCTACMDGYVAVGGVCTACTAPCKTCTDNVTNCATCTNASITANAGVCFAFKTGAGLTLGAIISVALFSLLF